MTEYLLSGKEFNEKFTGRQMVKLTNESEIHNNYKFKTGLNVDTIPFRPLGSCRAGGIYFCLFDHLNYFLNYNGEFMFYVRFVTIPDNAQVWVEFSKFKADQLILSDRQKIIDLDIWSNSYYCEKSWHLNRNNFRYIREQTPEICLKAVKYDGRMLEYVLNQTPEINLAAVQELGWALRFVKEQTRKFVWKLLKTHHMHWSLFWNRHQKFIWKHLGDNQWH